MHSKGETRWGERRLITAQGFLWGREGGRKEGRCEEVRLCVRASLLLFLLTQLMTDVAGNPEEERRTEFYQAPWLPEAVGRYIYSKASAFLVKCAQVRSHFHDDDPFCRHRCSRGGKSWSRCWAFDSPKVPLSQHSRREMMLSEFASD